MRYLLLTAVLLSLATLGMTPQKKTSRHLQNIRQITHGDVNGEAYFSFNGKYLTFQSTRGGRGCYQQYITDTQGSFFKMISTGGGATTCGYFLPGDEKVLFSSTHARSEECPAKPAQGSGKYRWPLDDYDIYVRNLKTGELTQLTNTPGYDAEAVVSPDGKKIAFTSIRDGDLEIYTMDIDGTNVKRLTFAEGYDGGPFFSPDSKRIVYRAYHPTDPAELDNYRELLKQNIVEPGHVELFIMNADGSDQHQITHNGASNFAPYFHPDNRHVIFSSSQGDGKSFELFMIGDDGKNLEQITFDGGFNSFPMFSPDGKQLVWISSRDGKQKGEMNIFIADWAP